MELQEWKEKNKVARRYAHFDEKKSLDAVWGYIENPDNIKIHSFYPFIHYSKQLNKYKKEQGMKKGEIRPKTREICYSAHVDRYIYSYYGFLINQSYNQYALKHGIDKSAVAYRDNLGENNIHFAKKTIDFIRKSEKCHIIIGDFTKFFDMLDHEYLKKCLCEILGGDRSWDDFYAVFKNITRFSIWELTDLLELNGLQETEKDISVLNNKRRVLSKNEFRKNKKKYVIRNKEAYGIPQGSAISAVLANVYMIKVDERINQICSKYEGMYMRYSDDFIAIIPRLNDEEFKKCLNTILNEIKSVPRLELQSEKTQIFRYDKTELKSCNSAFFENVVDGQNKMDYLGFSFNGKEVEIRDKTITKYYYRLYRKLNTIVKNRGYTKNQKRISCKNVYDRYSIKGAHIKDKDGKVRGNFITYVQRAQEIFGESDPIDKKTKRHMVKIRRKIDEAFQKMD